MTGPNANSDNHAGLMDSIYQYQRHIYDVTRKYYLLGRDHLIQDMNPKSGETVLEVGCGTGRNLIAAAKRFPDAQYYGFDISAEMLVTARRNVEKAGLGKVITLAQGNASNFANHRPFEHHIYDRIFYSYCLSMIPPWQDALDQGFLSLSDHGSLHVVDFGQQEGHPGWSKAVLRKWLAVFHVEPRSNLHSVMQQQSTKHDRTCEFSSLYRGYTWYFHVEKPV